MILIGLLWVVAGLICLLLASQIGYVTYQEDEPLSDGGWDIMSVAVVVFALLGPLAFVLLICTWVFNFTIRHNKSAKPFLKFQH